MENKAFRNIYMICNIKSSCTADFVVGKGDKILLETKVRDKKCIEFTYDRSLQVYSKAVTESLTENPLILTVDYEIGGKRYQKDVVATTGYVLNSNPDDQLKYLRDECYKDIDLTITNVEVKNDENCN